MENVAKLTQKVDDLTEAVVKQEQYSRHNCLILHGIPEKKQENNDELCIKVVNEHLDLDINDWDINDRTHHIGNPRKTDEKLRPIIINLWDTMIERRFLTVRKSQKERRLQPRRVWQLRVWKSWMR